jgi:hypothetical protein
VRPPLRDDHPFIADRLHRPQHLLTAYPQQYSFPLHHHPTTTPAQYKLFFLNIGGALTARLAHQAPLRIHLMREKYDIIALADTRVYEHEVMTAPVLPNFSMFMMAPWEPETRTGGMVIYVRNTLTEPFLYTTNDTNTMAYLDFPHQKTIYAFGYIPPNTTQHRPCILNAHRSIRTHVHESLSLNYRVVYLADWNARAPHTIRVPGSGYSQTRKTRTEQEMDLLHTFGPCRVLTPQSPHPHHHTFHCAGRGVATYIDYVLYLTPTGHVNHPTTDIIYEAYLAPDHYPITCTIPMTVTTNTSISPTAFRFLEIPQCMNIAQAMWLQTRHAVHATLMDLLHRARFDARYRSAAYFFLTYAQYMVGVQSGALRIIPTTTRKPTTTTHPVRDNFQKTSMSLRIKLLQDPGNARLIRTLRANDTRYAQWNSGQQFLRLAKAQTKLENRLLQGRIRKFWAGCFGQTTPYLLFPNRNGTYDPNPQTQLRIVTDFYRELYHSDFVLQDNDQRLLQHHLRLRNDSVLFTKELTLQSIRKKKVGASGIDGTSVTLFKKLFSLTPVILMEYYNNTFGIADVPVAALVERTVCLLKKYGFSPSVLRGIGVQNTITAVALHGVATMFTAITENTLHGASGGFRQKRCIQDQIGISRAAIISQYEQQLEIALLQYDINKCFDTIPHPPMELAAAVYDGNGPIYRTCCTILRRRTVIIQWHGLTADAFRATRGTPQGSALSVRFPVLLYDAIPRALHTAQLGVTMGSQLICCLLYADDISTLANTAPVASAQRDIIRRHLLRWKQTLNPAKTEYMIFSSGNTREFANQMATRFPQATRKTDTLRQLGYRYGPTLPNSQRHFQGTAHAAWAKYMALRERGYLAANNAPRTYTVMWTSTIRAALLFTCEIQYFTAANIWSLAQMERRFMSAAFNLHSNNHGALLHLLTGITPITTYIHLRQWTYWVKVITSTPTEIALRFPRKIYMEEVWQVLQQTSDPFTHPPTRKRFTKYRIFTTILVIAQKIGYNTQLRAHIQHMLWHPHDIPARTRIRTECFAQMKLYVERTHRELYEKTATAAAPVKYRVLRCAKQKIQQWAQQAHATSSATWNAQKPNDNWLPSHTSSPTPTHTERPHHL